MYRLLIVEDEQTIAQTLKNHLDPYHYDCFIESDFGEV